jgi:two-component system, OmpR family, response regulator
MNKPLKIFMVEDDPNFGSVMKSFLELNDFKVIWIQNGKNAIYEIQNSFFDFDLCLVDIMLPFADGFSVARKIKEKDESMPLIFLTAKSLKDDVIKGFTVGADDYIIKPFDSDVLILKIKAILKRKTFENQEEKEFSIQIGKFVFIPSERFIVFENTKQKLSPKESELLLLLWQNRNIVVNREKALTQIWGDNNYFTGRSMDVFITRIRKVLKDDPNIEIANIHGSGFIFKLKNN